MKEEKGTFVVRSYTKSELAHLYNPQLTLKNATQVLRRWILHNAELHAELIHLGYQDRNHIFTASPTCTNHDRPFYRMGNRICHHQRKYRNDLCM